MAVLELFLLQLIGLLFPLQSIVDLVEPNFGDVALVGFLQSFQCRGVACVPLFLQFVVGVLPLDPIGFRLLEKFVYLLFFGCGRLLLLKTFLSRVAPSSIFFARRFSNAAISSFSSSSLNWDADTISPF